MFGSWLAGILARVLAVGAFVLLIAGIVAAAQNHDWALVSASLILFFLASFLRYLSGHTVRVKQERRHPG